MDYSKMSDAEINMAVAAIVFPEREVIESKSRPPSACVIGHLPSKWVDYCNNPADAWPLIEASFISIQFYQGNWMASVNPSQETGFRAACSIEMKKPLRAAMIVFLMMQESDQSPS